MLTSIHSSHYPLPSHHDRNMINNNYGINKNEFSVCGMTVAEHDMKEYGAEIYQYMTSLEDTACPSPTYMDTQSEITWRMRKILVGWLIEVHIEYKLQQETLYLAINIIDRVCSNISIGRHQYQLLGITALWLAAKYEENHGRVPSLKNLAYICCHSYREKDFVWMERLIIKELSFDLGVPTLEAFLKTHCALFLKSSVGLEAMDVARYILDVSLLHRRFVGMAPSLVSLAALLLADEIMGYRQWFYEDPRLTHCVDHLADCLFDPPAQVTKKYSSDKWKHVITRVSNWVQQSRFELSSTQQNQPIQNIQPMSSRLTDASQSGLLDQFRGLITPPKDIYNSQLWSDSMLPPTVPMKTQQNMSSLPTPTSPNLPPLPSYYSHPSTTSSTSVMPYPTNAHSVPMSCRSNPSTSSSVATYNNPSMTSSTGSRSTASTYSTESDRYLHDLDSMSQSHCQSYYPQPHVTRSNSISSSDTIVSSSSTSSMYPGQIYTHQRPDNSGTSYTHLEMSDLMKQLGGSLSNSSVMSSNPSHSNDTGLMIDTSFATCAPSTINVSSADHSILSAPPMSEPQENIIMPFWDLHLMPLQQQPNSRAYGQDDHSLSSQQRPQPRVRAV